MERLIQLLDDLDDLIAAIGLQRERVRSPLSALVFACVALCIQIGGVLLALRHPPLALAIAILMFVTLLYRAVTTIDNDGRAPAVNADAEPLEIA